MALLSWNNPLERKRGGREVEAFEEACWSSFSIVLMDFVANWCLDTNFDCFSFQQLSVVYIYIYVYIEGVVIVVCSEQESVLYLMDHCLKIKSKKPINGNCVISVDTLVDFLSVFLSL